MNAKTYVVVSDDQGKRGIVELEGAMRAGGTHSVPITYDDGSRVMVRSEDLVEQADGTYALSRAAAERSRLEAASDEHVVVPVVQETVEIDKRLVETGKVRIHKQVHEREAVVEEPLLHDEIEVQRVAVNKFVDEPAAVRQEGDTTIIPVLEEVLVVEKRLLVKEELHVTRRTVETKSEIPVTVRQEEVVVERESAEKVA